MIGTAAVCSCLWADRSIDRSIECRSIIHPSMPHPPASSLTHPPTPPTPREHPPTTPDDRRSIDHPFMPHPTALLTHTHTHPNHARQQEAKHRMVTTPLVPGGRSRGGGGADKRKQAVSRAKGRNANEPQVEEGGPHDYSHRARPLGLGLLCLDTTPCGHARTRMVCRPPAARATAAGRALGTRRTAQRPPRGGARAPSRPASGRKALVAVEVRRRWRPLCSSSRRRRRGACGIRSWTMRWRCRLRTGNSRGVREREREGGDVCV